MAPSFKVRMADGEEVGPIDGDMLQSWFETGIVAKDTLVLPRGAKRWARLIDVVDIRHWQIHGAPRRRGAGPAEPDARDDGQGLRWRTVCAGALLLAAAAGAGYFWWFPARWLPSLSPAPWAEMAGGLAVLGLLLIRAWEVPRRVVRVLLLLATFALFPLAGLLWAQGVRGRGLLVMASAWVLGMGFFALIARAPLSWLQATGTVVLVLAGAAGIGYFGFVP